MSRLPRFHAASDRFPLVTLALFPYDHVRKLSRTNPRQIRSARRRLDESGEVQMSATDTGVGEPREKHGSWKAHAADYLYCSL